MNQDPTRIVSEDLDFLFQYFINTDTHAAQARAGSEMKAVQAKANALFAVDYVISILDNTSGKYCNTYPLELVILESHRNGTAARLGKINDAQTLSVNFLGSRFSRVHGRFVVPTILCRGQNICRSSTLSIMAESVMNQVTSKAREIFDGFSFSLSPKPLLSAVWSGSFPSLPPGLETQRTADEELLRFLGVRHICDFMVEGKKKKLGLQITSSEKVESDRYGKFSLLAVPYPGCEFFTLYRLNNRIGTDLVFDWTQSFVDAKLSIPGKTTSPPTSPPTPHSTSLHTNTTSSLLTNTTSPPTPCTTSSAMSENGFGEIERRRKEETTQLPPTSTQSVVVASHTTQSVVVASLSSDRDTLQNGTQSVAPQRETRSVTPVPRSLAQRLETCDWSSYRSWDIVEITKNYLALMLHKLQAASTDHLAHTSPPPAVNATAPPTEIHTLFPELKTHVPSERREERDDVKMGPPTSMETAHGLLVHCISGWDRTPLFVSLLRLSLWADGEAHETLTPIQMLYLTVAYDWMLFTHQLKNRLGKGEDVFFFCFDFLQHITGQEFSITNNKTACESVSTTPSISVGSSSLESKTGTLSSVEQQSHSNMISIPSLETKTTSGETNAKTITALSLESTTGSPPLTQTQQSTNECKSGVETLPSLAQHTETKQQEKVLSPDAQKQSDERPKGKDKVMSEIEREFVVSETMFEIEDLEHGTNTHKLNGLSINPLTKHEQVRATAYDSDNDDEPAFTLEAAPFNPFTLEAAPYLLTDPRTTTLASPRTLTHSVSTEKFSTRKKSEDTYENMSKSAVSSPIKKKPLRKSPLAVSPFLRDDEENEAEDTESGGVQEVTPPSSQPTNTNVTQPTNTNVNATKLNGSTSIPIPISESNTLQPKRSLSAQDGARRVSTKERSGSHKRGDSWTMISTLGSS